MPETVDIGSPSSSESHRRHKRKRKTRRKLWRRIIVIGVSLLICGGALAAWHFLVEDLPPRTAAPETAASRLLKA